MFSHVSSSEKLRKALVGIAIVGVAAMASICFGKVVADTANAPGLLIAKFTFEEPSSAADWHFDAKPGTFDDTLVIDQSNPHSGTGCLKFQFAKDTNTDRLFYAGAPVDQTDTTVGRHVRFRFYARTAGIQAGDAAFDVLEHKADKTVAWLENKPTILAIEPSTAWKEYDADGVLSDNATVLTLMFQVKNPSPDKCVWIDDLSVEQVRGTAK